MILILFVRYKHEILMVKYAKPNQKLGFVRYNREFAITVIVITEFDLLILVRCPAARTPLPDNRTLCYFECWLTRPLIRGKKILSRQSL
jgi:hypothetical protein